MKLCVVNGRTILTLVNLPGCQHAKALQLQAQYGGDFLFKSDWKENRLNIRHIGSTQSTFLGMSCTICLCAITIYPGMNEMLQAANLMDANISLTFEDTRGASWSNPSLSLLDSHPHSSCFHAVVGVQTL